MHAMLLSNNKPNTNILLVDWNIAQPGEGEAYDFDIPGWKYVTKRMREVSNGLATRLIELDVKPEKTEMVGYILGAE